MKSCAIYANCEVAYNGRASSTLPRGNYLIIIKEDKSLLIHGSNMCQARNYLGTGTSHHISRYTPNEFTLHAKKKSETIDIRIFNVTGTIVLDNWSNHKVMMRRTEQELKELIMSDPIRHLGILPAEIHEEYRTEHGPVDILCSLSDMDDPSNIIHVVEVKRRKVTKNDVMQLLKYMSCFECHVVGHLAAPDISKNCLEFCQRTNIQFNQVTFQ
jgi:endonuclease